ncbi:hypothetical protein BCR32DRAFT_290202 [Anaeromyces robustus]|uniref:Acyltransferase 3 domain-containing protein n=1 Tax=Anaeromyces robustus TaxID=1754192 RepID=A0A1Y1XKJ8_9FUNG|nr:hypothetical protein BCR32DRAFT_290202 [Anaeromyces robustus]|eukprot:ORX86223.1 hypothetical protein BCR32DRAFT_290202 [Anaeromyces robustus]
MSEIYEEEYISLNAFERSSTNQTLINNENDDIFLERIEIQTISKRKKERIYWIDCLRVFSSMLVVFHNVTFTDVPHLEFDSYNWKILYFYNSFTRPCVPLFIMISGVFFLNPERKITLESIYKKYLFRIFKCYVFWTIYYNVFDYLIINYIHFPFKFDGDLALEILKYCILGLGHLWYLNFAFGLYALTPIFREVARNKKMAIYTAGCGILVAQFIPSFCDFIRVFLDFDISILKTFFDSTLTYGILGYTNYFMLGYLLGCFNLNRKVYIYIVYVIGIIGIAGTPILKFGSAYILKQHNNYFGRYNSFNVSMSTVGIFCFFKYYIGPKMNKLMNYNIFRSILLTLSEYSFGIYLIHMTVYHIFLRFGINSFSLNPLYWLPVYAIMIYLISFILIHYMRKVFIFREVT